ncbi:hypothetical protein M0R45_033542 [Rubus argutus]|uniref:Powdery mildew resistance protein, RPW8 n=1 Tax=Rubus argutus TaxID=59490 RepID=A0AAW1WME8_RUBAR
MAQYNQQLDRPKKELEAFEVLMKEGLELVLNCSELRQWNIYKKYKYSTKFLELNESLQKQFDVLQVQTARDVKKTGVTVENIQVSLENIKEEVSMLVRQNQSSEIEALSAVPELPALTVGLDAPLEELKAELLKDDVSMLVLTAPGGCGKTTLATKFCHDLFVKDKFKNNIFFVTVSKKPNLELIMKELYKQKCYEVPTFQNELASPVKWLQKFQKEKGDDPLLLVLDDVWSGSESLLEMFEFKMSNYKILVTSRSEFRRFGSSYHLQLLDNDNAMKLFHHTAFLGDKSSHIPKDLSKMILKRCNGFPLAITVAGRSLCGQPIEMWQSRVMEWSKGSSILDFEIELLLRLQSSLDALDNEMPMVKECFLDLGVFPEDAEIRVTALIDMWAELYDLDEETLCISKLYELNGRSLANFSQKWGFKVEADRDYAEYVVKQHDLLRERVIIEISGNNLPKWWREQKYQPTMARLVSISTDGELSVK